MRRIDDNLQIQIKIKVRDMNYLKAEHVYHKVLEMMAVDYQPVPVVTDVGFISLLQIIEHRYVLLNDQGKYLYKISTLITRCEFYYRYLEHWSLKSATDKQECPLK